MVIGAHARVVATATFEMSKSIRFLALVTAAPTILVRGKRSVHHVTATDRAMNLAINNLPDLAKGPLAPTGKLFAQLTIERLWYVHQSLAPARLGIGVLNREPLIPLDYSHDGWFIWPA